MRGAERRAGQERTRSGLVLKLVYGLTLQRDGRSRVSGLSENDVVKSMPELVSALSICDKVIADRPRTRAWPRPRCARLLGSSPKVAHADEGERASIPVPDHGGHGNRPALGRGGRRVRKLVVVCPPHPFLPIQGRTRRCRATQSRPSSAKRCRASSPETGGGLEDLRPVRFIPRPSSLASSSRLRVPLGHCNKPPADLHHSRPP
jgi:hypothetical protein